jgi:hypothetical protein
MEFRTFQGFRCSLNVLELIHCRNGKGRGRLPHRRKLKGPVSKSLKSRLAAAL